MNSLDQVIRRAKLFLLNAQGSDGLWRDFYLEPGESDEWVSGYVGSAVCRIDDPASFLSARKAWNVLGWRAMKGKAGWGYNGKAIADADSTAWCLRLAVLLGEAEKIIGLTGMEVIRDHITPEGGISTYTIRDINGGMSQEFIRHRPSGWLRAHSCVTAAAALLPWFSAVTIPYLKNNQHAAGQWSGYWWLDDEYATGLAAEALAQTDDPESRVCINRAVQWICSRLSPEGFIPNRFFTNGSPFATALGLRVLFLSENRNALEPIIAKMVEWLAGQQQEDGSWAASAIMRVPVPRVVNPEETLASVFGISIPESLKIRIVKEEKNQFFIVIPHLQKAEDELSEKELETVAGGWSGGTDCGTCLEDGCTYSCDDSLC